MPGLESPQRAGAAGKRTLLNRARTQKTARIRLNRAGRALSHFLHGLDRLLDLAISPGETASATEHAAGAKA